MCGGGRANRYILRSNLGKDLANITLPVTVNEPLSGMQRLAEEVRCEIRNGRPLPPELGAPTHGAGSIRDVFRVPSHRSKANLAFEVRAASEDGFLV